MESAMVDMRLIVTGAAGRMGRMLIKAIAETPGVTLAAATKAIADHGGKALARGGRCEALEGKARARNVVLEFDSFDAARRYFYSEQYQAARALRQGAAEMEMVLVEGS